MRRSGEVEMLGNRNSGYLFMAYMLLQRLDKLFLADILLKRLCVSGNPACITLSQARF